MVENVWGRKIKTKELIGWFTMHLFYYLNLNNEAWKINLKNLFVFYLNEKFKSKFRFNLWIWILNKQQNSSLKFECINIQISEGQSNSSLPSPPIQIHTQPALLLLIRGYRLHFTLFILSLRKKIRKSFGRVWMTCLLLDSCGVDPFSGMSRILFIASINSLVANDMLDFMSEDLSQNLI